MSLPQGNYSLVLSSTFLSTSFLLALMNKIPIIFLILHFLFFYSAVRRESKLMALKERIVSWVKQPRFFPKMQLPKMQLPKMQLPLSPRRLRAAFSKMSPYNSPSRSLSDASALPPHSRRALLRSGLIGNSMTSSKSEDCLSNLQSEIMIA